MVLLLLLPVAQDFLGKLYDVFVAVHVSDPVFGDIVRMRGSLR
jgi:hypothetical protein